MLCVQAMRPNIPPCSADRWRLPEGLNFLEFFQIQYVTELNILGARTNLGPLHQFRWLASASNLATGRLGSRLDGPRLGHLRLGFGLSSAHFRLGRAGFSLGHGWFGFGHCQFLGGVLLAGVAGQFLPRCLLSVTYCLPLGSTWPHRRPQHTNTGYTHTWRK